MFCSLRKRLVVLFNRVTSLSQTATLQSSRKMLWRYANTVKFPKKNTQSLHLFVKHFLGLCCFLEEIFIFFYETIKWMYGNPRKGNEA